MTPRPRPYEAGDAAVVAGWAGPREEGWRWCSRRSVTAADGWLRQAAAGVG